jgi:MoaA/NifB/PqqE/SkfB family radical SAM enzyme/SAM-dependent methyltransferase
MSAEAVADVVGQARELGAETFFLTGGEPLLRPDLPDLLALILDDPGAHAVVMTNASLLDDEFLARVRGLDRERLHLQVSLDGSTAELNDAVRSAGAYERTVAGIRRAGAAGLQTTVATVALEANLGDLPAMARLLGELEVPAWHLMWHQPRERGQREPAATVEAMTEAVLALRPEAAAAGVKIDNFEHMKAVINGEPDTKRDGTKACWDSLAVYSDGSVYPTAVVAGMEEFRGGSLAEQPLRRIWLDAPAFEEYRRRASLRAGAAQADPFAFLHGGGDPDHAYFHGGPEAEDPYLPLYRAMLLVVADEVAAERMAVIRRREDVPVAYHVMGQDGLGCPVGAGVVNAGPHRLELAPSNCVLTEDVVGHGRRQVQEYYGAAAVETKAELCCPVKPRRVDTSHIPAMALERSYGCGSPVSEAEVSEGETVVDLGSGGGLECFIAAKMVGPTGTVIGVDMTPEMLALAEETRREVAANLGYDNVRFVRGYLEALPLPDNSADAIISNCVINLSGQKLRVFSEVLRALRPGGRMVISDVTAGDAVPEQVKFNPRLKGECIGGAMTRDELLRLLTKVGFAEVRTISETPWRKVEGVQFYSDTVAAVKPRGGERPVPYAGIRRTTQRAEACCPERQRIRCMVCGAPLQYMLATVEAECAMCGRSLRTRSRCADGHFVCDQCHGGDYLRFVREFVAQNEDSDPVRVFLAMRRGYDFPLHGPEHHALVPAAFLAAYHRAHGYPDAETIWEAVEAGANLPGGTCAFWGSCSAALGVGIAYATILGATPLDAEARSRAQEAVGRILGRLAEFAAARCCRRESLAALQMACEMSAAMLPHELATDEATACDQAWENEECFGAECPYAERQRQDRGALPHFPAGAPSPSQRSGSGQAPLGP